MAKRSNSNWKPISARRRDKAPRRKSRRIPATLVNWIVVAGLLLLTAVAYVQVAGFEFTVYDDTAYVPDNPHVRDGFSLRGVGWAFTTFETANWYPLTWLSLMLECELCGPRPGVHHAVNAVLHAANAALLFAALRRMTGRRWPSAAVAALFAVHPLHVESVAWIAERKDVLSTFFFLLALLAYQRYAARPAIGRWVLVFLSMAAGLLCKPMLVTLPFVLLLLDYWPLKRYVRWASESVIGARIASEAVEHRPRLRVGLQSADGLGGPSYSPSTVPRLLLEKLPLLALSAGTAIVTMFAQASQGATKMIGDQTGLSLRLANAAIAYVKYLAMTLWPADLAVFYPYDFHPRPALIVVSIVLLAAVTAAAIALVRRAPYVAVGWFWYLGTLVPTIGLVQVGAQGLADRYNYIPSIGVFLVVVWAVASLRRGAGFQPANSTVDWQSVPRRRFAIAAAFSAAVVVLLVVAHRQVGYWINGEQLFRHALAVTGDNPESCDNLGDTLLRQDRFAEAEKEFRKILAMPDAEQFRQVPGELARAIAGQGPNRVGEAIAVVRETISDDQQKARALNDLALFLVPRRYYAKAIELLQEAMTLAPRQATIARNLASGFATCPDPRFRNGPKAVELARRACEMTEWSDASCRLALADAYHEVKDREHEIEELRAAHKLSPKDAGIEARLKAMSAR